MDAFRTNWTFIKVETDEGLCGWGEASLGTREHALEGCVEDMKRLIVGRNPIGIEIACWDIAGKFYNAPVCNLLGGRMREQVPMYANAWFTGARTPEQFAEKARYTVSKGVKALKWDPFGKAHMTLSRREMDAAVACVGAVREAVGPEVELLIECHGRFNHYTAVEMSRELAPLKPMFIEEPTVPDCIDSLRWVRNHSQVPVAAGERFYGNMRSGTCCTRRPSTSRSRTSSTTAAFWRARRSRRCARAAMYRCPSTTRPGRCPMRQSCSWRPARQTS